jgi:hypothetical protein
LVEGIGKVMTVHGMRDIKTTVMGNGMDSDSVATEGMKPLVKSERLAQETSVLNDSYIPFHD